MNRSLIRWFDRPGMLGVLLACGLGILGGCDAINPRLIGTLGGNPTATMRDAEGYIGIVMMNTTGVVSQVSMTLIKKNDSMHEFFGTMLPYDPTGQDDHLVGVFECDVASIRLDSLIYATGEGEPVEVQFDYGSFIYGQNMFCGDVIYVTVEGAPPNITASVGIY